MAEPLEHPIKVNHLSWRYGVNPVLENIHLDIEKGKFYSILGPNGSGKTTLLRTIAKGLKLSRGHVCIDNQDVMDIKEKEMARKISVVPQNTSVDFEFTVEDIVLMGRNPYIKRFCSETEQDIVAVKNAMLVTDTWKLRERKMNEVSGGERQRVIIARALAQDTGIMLLDEPVSQLDIHHQVEIMDTVRSLVDQRHMTVLMVLHDLNLAVEYSDSLILMDKGVITCQGLPEKVLTEENIERVYKVHVTIMNNPVTHKPHIFHATGIKRSI